MNIKNKLGRAVGIATSRCHQPAQRITTVEELNAAILSGTRRKQSIGIELGPLSDDEISVVAAGSRVMGATRI